VSEAFNNIVLHSYAADPHGIVTIHFYISREALEIELLDNGVGFDAKSSNVKCPDVRESGMGLYIIHSFVDEVEHCKGQPNRLRLKKFLRGPAG
ncbi:MAG TPA: ATP-binding protein, partial [Sorangium sp.]|nr:ATP-binding protein [Sorangium sp.]